MMQIGDTDIRAGKCTRKADRATVEVGGTFTVPVIDDTQPDQLVELCNVRVLTDDDPVWVAGNSYTVAQSAETTPAAATAGDSRRSAFIAATQWVVGQPLAAAA